MYLSKQNLIVWFLRMGISDPADRIKLQETKSDTVTNVNFLQVLNITENISHINNLKVDSVELEPFKDYVYDIKSRVILFRENITGTVEYDVYTGTNFIYTGKPLQSLNSYPRISLMVVDNPTERLGNFNAPTYSVMRVQFDFWCKLKESWTVNNGLYNVTLGEDRLSEYLAEQVRKLIIDSKDFLRPTFNDINPLNDPVDDGFVNDSRLFKYRYECRLSYLSNQDF